MEGVGVNYFVVGVEAGIGGVREFFLCFAYTIFWGVIHRVLGTEKGWKWGEKGLLVKWDWNLE